MNCGNIELDPDKPNFFRFRKVGDQVLITNDFGGSHFLSEADFKDFAEGKITPIHEQYDPLMKAGFLKSDIDVDMALNLYRSRNASIFYGPSLHIIVVTLRCNYKCVYCQASSRPMDGIGYDMDIETARKTVDFIFSTPNPSITIEFQGGEPLINWEAIKFITEYARQKEAETGKKVFLSLVSNLSLLDEEKLDFIIDHGVGLCTSIDGPEELHNLNRPMPGGNSYRETMDRVDRIKKLEADREAEKKPMYKLSALLTVSKRSLSQPKEIIDEYLKHGFTGIHLRPLSYLGDATKTGDSIGYSALEFMDFWKRSLDYILELNMAGAEFTERGSAIVLQKILKAMDPGYVDLKSPCGAVIGQMLYNYDGKIYTCDEGRMCEGDVFALGRVDDTGGEETKEAYNENYKRIVTGGKTKAMLVASTLDNTPCDYCAYKPYCGVCPVINYSTSGNLYPQMATSDWCVRQKAMFDYLFEKMQHPEYLKIFKKWI